MGGEIRRHFNEIIEDARTALEDVEIEQDYSVKRALLKISGKFRKFKVRITEVVDEDKRKYAYYLITHIPHILERALAELNLCYALSLPLSVIQIFK